MPTLEEAASAFARDILVMNIPAVMASFTPDGMLKLLALQGQLLAQAQAAGQTVAPSTSGPTSGGPLQPPATEYTALIEESVGEDHPVRLSFAGPAGTGVFRTIWRQIDGVWKIYDLSVVELVADEPPQAASEGTQ